MIVARREQRGGFRGECAAQGAGESTRGVKYIVCPLFSGPFQQRAPADQVVTQPSGNRPLFLHLRRTHRSSVPRNRSVQLMICLSKINRGDTQGYFCGHVCVYKEFAGSFLCCLLTLSAGDVSHCVRTTEPEGGGHLPYHLLLCTRMLSLKKDMFRSSSGT